MLGVGVGVGVECLYIYAWLITGNIYNSNTQIQLIEDFIPYSKYDEKWLTKEINATFSSFHIECT